MRNIFIIGIIIISLGYMFTILADKYDTIKKTSPQSTKTNQQPDY